MASRRFLMSGTDLVSKLTPMKRILCVCPTPRYAADGSVDDDDYAVGFAVSDPYLAFASPVEDVNVQAWLKDCLEAPPPLSLSPRDPVRKAERSTLFHTRLLDRLGFRDVGAVAFALPLQRDDNDNNNDTAEDRRLSYLRGCLREVCSEETETFNVITSTMINDEFLQREIKPHYPFALQCEIDQRLTVREARTLSDEEPEMWEEVQQPIPDDPSRIKPSTHAAVALNSFLWEHTGGWRNTFA